jgi:hypothetical protein
MIAHDLPKDLREEVPSLFLCRHLELAITKLLAVVGCCLLADRPSVVMLLFLRQRNESTWGISHLHLG